MTAYLGDYVETIPFGYRGRVTKVHHWCPESDGWLAGQTGLGPDPMQFKKNRWISILVHGGGSVVFPDDPEFIMHVEPFDLDNLWADEYFRENAEVPA